MFRRRGLDKPKDGWKRDYHRSCRMSQAEIIVTMIMFHSSNHKCLKHFYLNEICVRYRHLFPQTVSYNKFTELKRSVVVQSLTLTCVSSIINLHNPSTTILPMLHTYAVS